LAGEPVFVFDACALIAFLVTSDHHELDRLAQAAVCPMLFIR